MQLITVRVEEKKSASCLKPTSLLKIIAENCIIFIDYLLQNFRFEKYLLLSVDKKQLCWISLFFFFNLGSAQLIHLRTI